MLERLRRRSDPAVLAAERSKAIKTADRAAGRVHRLRTAGRHDKKAERELLTATADFLRIESRARRAGVVEDHSLALTH